MLSLLYVAACTPKDIEVKLVDEQIEAIDFNEPADLVGISFMTALSYRAFEIADKFRERGVKVVCGGFHPSFRPEECLEHADAVCIGEAESTWPQLIADLKQGKMERIYKAEGRADLAKLNLPRRDLLKTKNYAPVVAVQTSRGCNHKCNFCSVTSFFGSRHCVRPVDDVIKEITAIKGKDLIFIDDNIVADREYAKELFRAMVPLKKKWISQASIYIADDIELVKLAKKSGCMGLFIGIESLNVNNLKNARKGFNNAQKYVDSIRTLHKYGIGIEAGIVFGFDHDDVNVFRNTLQFLLDNNVEAIQASILTPLPGTPLHEKMDKEGRIISKEWKYYDYRHAVIKPELMSSGELQAGVDWVINRFYSPWNILKRVVKSMFYMGPQDALMFCSGVNFAYLTRVFQWGIKGFDPAPQVSSPGEVSRKILFKWAN
jgi:radical SAM superfamily enzyme YgiQ (UPF0313 family)